MLFAAPGAKLYLFCATPLYGVFFNIFLILENSQFSVLVLFLQKNCFSMVLKVSTEQPIFNTLDYNKKKGTREFK